MVYVKYKDLTKGTETDKVLRDKDFKIASNPNHYRYQRGLASMVFTSFCQRSIGSCIKSLTNHQELANELHKSIIKSF